MLSKTHARSPLLAIAISALSVLFVVCQAGAAPVKIVALRASNTAGEGVGASAAWPAQLEAMLRARGYDATVANAGISGDDTGRMAASLGSAVPDGTQLVILEKAAANDRMRNVDTEANVRTVAAQLNARGVRLIVIPAMHGWANRQIQADGIQYHRAGPRCGCQSFAPAHHCGGSQVRFASPTGLKNPKTHLYTCTTGIAGMKAADRGRVESAMSALFNRESI
jgi:acyl-CoA thioesterase-1